jgi:hypothetical protein
MPNNLSGEQCVSCGAAAAVRVTGTSFCASCGLRQHGTTSAPPRTPTVRQSHRAALVGILSSGFLVKMLMGAVALAAVGGVTASLRSEPVPVAGDVIPVVETMIPGTSTTFSTAATDTPAIGTDDDTGVDAGKSATANGGESAAVHDYAVSIQAWAECVSDAVTAHLGGEFDPSAACGDLPAPGDFGVDGRDDDGESADPPGQDDDGPGNSEDAPGHDDDGPGNSEDAPGHDDDGPGNSEDAPGHDDDGPGNSENAPGPNGGGDDDEQKKDKPPKEEDK